ncbi:MAG: SGNH/GDSL hydrolase family protein [Gammaproteobacteria bacterium]|jgi:lysophospholipase L1-like esterase
MTYTSDIGEFYDIVIENPTNKNILIEGDSWVSHPQVKHLADQFYRLNDNLNILNLASPGDMAIAILDKHTREYETLAALLDSPQFAYKFDMIFLSAAGNDIIGPEVRYFVDDKITGDGRYGEQYLNTFFDRVVTYLKQDYERFITLRNNSRFNSSTPIITHCYSRLKTRQNGTEAFGIKFNKGWLDVYLTDKGFSNQDEKNHIASGMLTRFRDSLMQIQDDNFLVVDTLNVLLDSDNQPDEAYFHDEIHPNDEGFERVAKTIMQVAKQAGFWPE